MTLVFFHGPAAAGKLTVARELASLSGLPVFHNHLAVDAAAALFEFGSEPFVQLRHAVWMQAFRLAAEQKRSLIFTFTPEPTVPLDFVDQVRQTVEGAGGRILFVELQCGPEEQERRIDNPSRQEFGKLRSVDLLREIRQREVGLPVAVPPADLRIDPEKSDPRLAAEMVLAAMGDD